MDVEAHERGETLYAPDENARLYPPVLSEGAASLLPDQTRPAVVWTMDVDETGEGVEVNVRHALVRSRAKLDYVSSQQALDGGTADEQLRLLREVGLLRQQREVRRGGVSLAIPEQVITQDDGAYGLQFRAPLPVEGWNAQMSLMTGMAAAELMLKGGVGLLRTVPLADPHRLRRLRLTAKALRVEWPDDVPYPAFVRSLSPFIARQAALLIEAASLLRGSSYTWFEDVPPEQPTHSALASTYAHTTAPLRRLVDRYVGEACIALSDGREVPEWVRAELPTLPEVMAKSGARAGQYEAGIVSIVEAALLAPRVGDTFDRHRHRAARAPRGSDRGDPRAVGHRPLPGRRPPARRPDRGATRRGGRDAAPRAVRAGLAGASSTTRCAVANVSSPNSTSRASATDVSAARSAASAWPIASSSGHPYAPAETSGNATVAAPSSSATASELV